MYTKPLSINCSPYPKSELKILKVLCDELRGLSPLCRIRVKARWDYSEKPHECQNDSRTHFTTVLQDDKGSHIKTQHIAV